MNSLVGVAIRFRQEKVALAADKEGMLRLVHVTETDCDSLRFLPWPNGDMNKPLKKICMQVHLFGTTSSPSCTSYALKRTAINHCDLYEQEVVNTVQRNFYLDDCLKSMPSEEATIQNGGKFTKFNEKGRIPINEVLK